MEFRKISIALLALLLAAIVMVPMVSAHADDIYVQSFARSESSSEHLFGGRGDYNHGGNLYGWVVKVELKDASSTVLQTEWEYCSSGNDCSTGYRPVTSYIPPGDYDVVTTVWANGVNARSGVYHVTFPFL